MNKTPAEARRLSSKLADLLLDASLALGVGEAVDLVLLGLGLPLLLGLLGTSILIGLEGILTDGLVGIGVDLLEVTSVNLVLNVLGELGLVALLILIGEVLHVLGDVGTVDVVLEGLGVELLGLDVVTGETAVGVGDEDTTVGGTLHGSEDTVTGGSTDKTNIEEGLEGAALAIIGLDGLGESVLTGSLLDTLELLVKVELLEDTTGKEKTGGVGGSPVGKTLVNAVLGELVSVGRGENLVTGDLRVDDLGDDVAVGEANNHAVLGRVVLVLGLGDQALASIVVGLTLAAATVLSLEATIIGKVSVGLDVLGERL
ncbi:hypothetical protein N7449_012008 [Penicillium cf. viridicatum]|uniref:Uncharacterized protein n=1 Tax=Penicillium cf. viridicatum TaxID=2972119 RepID=A0A9W9IU24_9EURO|nr:hypothetical protein N7449_012008 [Penicillium cf. viridicatum]